MGDTAEIVKFGIGLLAILNPVGVAPLYLALTDGNDTKTRRHIALIAAFSVAVTLTVVMLAGRQLLGLFSVSVDDLRVAGGLILLLIALSMLTAQPSSVNTGDADMAHGKTKQSPAVVPLAIPMLSGPGAIATVIIEAGARDTVAAKGVLLALIFINAAIIYMVFRAAVPLQRRLGESGMNIIVRVMGLVLAAIAVNMMATGLRGEFPVLLGKTADAAGVMSQPALGRHGHDATWHFAEPGTARLAVAVVPGGIRSGWTGPGDDAIVPRSSASAERSAAPPFVCL